MRYDEDMPSETIRHHVTSEEWIEDHTGVKRKPFRVMHREVWIYILTLTDKRCPEGQDSSDAQLMQRLRLPEAHPT